MAELKLFLRLTCSHRSKYDQRFFVLFFVIFFNFFFFYTQQNEITKFALTYRNCQIRVEKFHCLMIQCSMLKKWRFYILQFLNEILDYLSSLYKWMVQLPVPFQWHVRNVPNFPYRRYTTIKYNKFWLLFPTLNSVLAFVSVIPNLQHIATIAYRATVSQILPFSTQRVHSLWGNKNGYIFSSSSFSLSALSTWLRIHWVYILERSKTSSSSSSSSSSNECLQ